MASRPQITVGELQQKLATDPRSLTVDEFKQLDSIKKLKQSKIEEEESRWFVSKSEAALLIGCSVGNIDKLHESNKIIRREMKYDVRTICEFLRGDRERKKAEAESVTGTTPLYESMNKQLRREQARFRKIKADMAEIDLKMRNGEAVLTEQVIGEISRSFMALRDNLFEAQKRLADSCYGQDVRTISNYIDKEVRRILNDFHRVITSPLPSNWKDRFLTHEAINLDDTTVESGSHI